MAVGGGAGAVAVDGAFGAVDDVVELALVVRVVDGAAVVESLRAVVGATACEELEPQAASTRAPVMRAAAIRTCTSSTITTDTRRG